MYAWECSLELVRWMFGVPAAVVRPDIFLRVRLGLSGVLREQTLPGWLLTEPTPTRYTTTPNHYRAGQLIHAPLCGKVRF
jgi:hypothetical protein